MTMNYQKITVPLFADRLRTNMYKSITAARRAIGKADWGEAERQKARGIADRHFKAKTIGPAVQPHASSKTKTVARPQASTPIVRKPAAPLSASTSTNAEIIEFCGTANVIVETIRKSSEISLEAKQTLAEATALLMDCFRIVHAALKKVGPEVQAAKHDRRPKGVGNSVAPKTFIESDESRSAAS